MNKKHQLLQKLTDNGYCIVPGCYIIKDHFTSTFCDLHAKCWSEEVDMEDGNRYATFLERHGVKDEK